MQTVFSPDIAIIGIACRLPGADQQGAFFQNLLTGLDAVQTSPTGRNMGLPGGFLDDLSLFDANHFGISPNEAVWMDPRQRLFLETAWDALEHAALSPPTLAGSNTGVFVGCYRQEYPPLSKIHPEIYAAVGGTSCITANRLSYILDLRGPSFTVDTASSASLTAVHQACLHLRTGGCDLAVAGGVNLMLDEALSAAYHRAGMLGSGRSRAFDQSADGYARGEGCGVVILKRREDTTPQDRILAVIRGSAINQDGRTNGITAPSSDAQTACIQTALNQAHLTPQDLHYLETHGSGTPLGDHTELTTLNRLFADRNPEDPCWVGSVKTNIGHLEAAAGIAGLIKCVLALHHGQIPANLHFNNPNPCINWSQAAFRVPTQTTPWPKTDQRNAAVLSYGFGGSNAAVVLNAPPKAEPHPLPQTGSRMLALSGSSGPALQTRARHLADHLQQNPTTHWWDLCHTNNLAAADGPMRAVVHAETPADAVTALHAAADQHHQPKDTAAPPLAMLFTGQGSPYSGMGRELYARFDTFRADLDQCAAILADLPDPRFRQHGLTQVMFNESHADLLQQTAYAQPALFALEAALTRLWSHLGVTPSLLLGHSVGELAAAHAAGVFSLEDGLRLVEARGRLMGSAPGDGMMVAVEVDPDTLSRYLPANHPRVVIGVYNGPHNTVLSGFTDAVTPLLDSLTQAGIKHQALKVSHAFHSPQMDPILDAFAKVADTVTFHPPTRPMISNLTGAVAQDWDAAGWVRRVREPVRFSDALRILDQTHTGALLEIGPHPVLLGLAKPQLTSKRITLPSLHRKVADLYQWNQSLGELFLSGQAIHWRNYEQAMGGAIIDLPGYPFQRQSYWLSPEQLAGAPSPPDFTPTQTSRSMPKPPPPTQDPDFSTRLATASEDNRKRMLADQVRNKLAQLLGLPKAELRPNRALKEMGVDSMLSQDLTEYLETLTGRQLTSSLVFNYPNINTIAAYLAQMTAPAEPAANTPATAAPADTDPEHVTGDDMEAMLAGMADLLDESME